MNATSHDDDANADRAISLRILDANLNRAMEALRTLEDIARFKDRSFFQHEYKELRHSLRNATKSWSASDLLSSRSAMADVGRTDKQPAELSRTDGLKSIVGAATQRAQQSLRSLEEHAKFLYPDTVANVEVARYRIYDINASFALSLERDMEFLTRAKLYVLADCGLPLKEFAERVTSIGQSGVDIIQLRDKEADASKLLEYLDAARESVNVSSTKLIVNDRVDVAKASKAWGVHVGQTDLTVRQSRSMLDAEQVVGLSTHDLNQVRSALEQHCDYIGCGPTFASSTKQFDSFSGLEFLKSARAFLDERCLTLPIFAIGGIRVDNLESVLATGIKRVAVQSAIWSAESPSVATSSMREILDRNEP